MKNHHRIIAIFLGVALLSAASALAQPPDKKNAVTVFGGISLMDASGDREWRFDELDFPDIPGFPMFPGFPHGPGMIPGITVRGEESLGSSALFGARYSRQIKERLAAEADFAIAPTHDIEVGGEVCIDGFGCYGNGRGPMGRFDGGFGKRGVTAWHYGGGLSYDLTEGDVRPFLAVGAGGVTWDGASETDFVFRFGGGLKVLFGNLGLRVDVTDHLVVDHFISGDNEHDVHATAGFLVGF
jgi:hypothetical protein